MRWMLISILVVGCAGGTATDERPRISSGAALFADIRHADWSPDGTRFVVTRAAGDGGDIVLMDLRGEIVSVLAASSATELTADWSPDGSTVAYARRQEGGAYEVWSVPVEGAEPRAVVGPDFPWMFPRWSPDGRRLVFNSIADEGMRQVYTSAADGSDVRQITSDERGHSDYPSWSPGGAWVVFESNRSGEWETYRARPDGSGVEQITRNGSSAPRLSPDGSILAFHDQRNGIDYDIFLIDADGTHERLLVGGPGDQRLPEWSPDGSRVAYISNAGGHHDLFVLDVGDRITVRVTRQPEGEFFNLLFHEGREAARARLDEVRDHQPRPRFLRDARTARLHTRWLASAGDSADARFVLRVGLDEFPDDEGLVALRDSLVTEN